MRILILILVIFYLSPAYSDEYGINYYEKYISECSKNKPSKLFVPDRKFGNIISQYNSIPVLTYLFDKIGLNSNNFDNEFQDIMQIKSGKGAYFELK